MLLMTSRGIDDVTRYWWRHVISRRLTSSRVAVSSPALQSHLLLSMKMFGCDNLALTRLKKLFSCKIKKINTNKTFNNNLLMRMSRAFVLTRDYNSTIWLANAVIWLVNRYHVSKQIYHPSLPVDTCVDNLTIWYNKHYTNCITYD